MLYHASVASIREGDRTSQAFNLAFDDMLLFLDDTGASLREVMAIITFFGSYSSLTINWAKPALLQLGDVVAPSLADFCPVPVVRSFKYLDIYISPIVTDYCTLNIMLLMHGLRATVSIWNKLWISMIGKANLIKMIYMLQLLYLLHNSPVLVPLYFFRLVNTNFPTLLWKDKSPRIRLGQLQRHKDRGGVALPNPWLYYLEAEMQHPIGGFLIRTNIAASLSPSVHSHMRYHMKMQDIPGGLEYVLTPQNRLYPTYFLLQKVWLKVKPLQGSQGLHTIALFGITQCMER